MISAAAASFNSYFQLLTFNFEPLAARFADSNGYANVLRL